MVVELALPAMRAGRAGRAALRGAGAAPALGLRLRRRRAAHALDHRRHGGAGHWAASVAAVATALMATNLVRGHRARRRRLLADRHRRRRGRDVAAGAARHARRPERRRAAAATIVWVMMIAGFVVTAPHRRPFPRSLLAGAARRGHRRRRRRRLRRRRARRARRGGQGAQAPRPRRGRRAEAAPSATRCARSGPSRQARRFTIFVFVSMLAYSAQDLILEPFAGLVFGMTPGAVDQARRPAARRRAGRHDPGRAGRDAHRRAAPRLAARLDDRGCIASALALVALALRGLVGPGYPLDAAVFALGVANGAFAVAAIGSMMALAGAGREWREGMRMGLWGAAQADRLRRRRLRSARSRSTSRARCHRLAGRRPTPSVFVGEAVLFLVGAVARWPRRRASPAGAPRRRGSPQPQVHEAAWSPDDRMSTTQHIFDVVVVGGGPGRRHRGATISPAPAVACCCSTGRGASSPAAARSRRALIRDFDIPDELLVARVTAARMISPLGPSASTCRSTAASSAWSTASISTNGCASARPSAGAERRTGTFETITRDERRDVAIVHYRRHGHAARRDHAAIRARLVIGADGAQLGRGARRRCRTRERGALRLRLSRDRRSRRRSREARPTSTPRAATSITSGALLAGLLRLDLPARRRRRASAPAPRTRASRCAARSRDLRGQTGLDGTRRSAAKARRSR